MKRRSFVQMLAALAALPFLPKLAAKPKVPPLVDNMGHGLSGWLNPHTIEDPGHSHGVLPMPVGYVSTYANKSSVPPGFLPCDGRIISPNQYPALAEALGTHYNPMPNSRLCKLPNMNGRIRLTTNPQDYDAYCGIRYCIKAK